MEHDARPRARLIYIESEKASSCSSKHCLFPWSHSAKMLLRLNLPYCCSTPVLWGSFVFSYSVGSISGIISHVGVRHWAHILFAPHRPRLLLYPGPAPPSRPLCAQAKQIQHELSQMQQDLSGAGSRELGDAGRAEPRPAGRSSRPEAVAAKR